MNLIDVGLALPAPLAANLVPRAKIWAESSHYALLPMKLGALVAHLARGGQVDQALDLARAFLAIQRDPRLAEQSAIDMSRWWIEVRARFDNWHYGEILKRQIPELVVAASMRGLILLCDLLDDAIRISQPPDQDTPPEDFSYVWRPAIEDMTERRQHDLRELLVSAVRDAAVQLTRLEMVSMANIVYALENRSWPIFRRLALHLLCTCPDIARDLIAERLIDRGRFNDRRLRREYFLLARQCFGQLSSEEQAYILAWIEEGPNLDYIQALYEQRRGRQPTAQEISDYADSWRLERLAIFSAHLPAAWRQRYEELVLRLGEPQELEAALEPTTVSWVKAVSPASLADLQGMSIEELIVFLQTWQPTDDLLASSPEGLVTELTGLIAVEPAHFAAEAARFLEVDPRYGRAFLAGLHTAVKERRVFNWPPVLEMCRSIAERPRGRTGQETSNDVHHSLWSWTHRVITDLLTAGFVEGSTQLPLSLRSAVWAALVPLTDDADPTQEYEAHADMDPATLSINTARGEALHTVMQYALWLRRQQEASNNLEQIARGFGEMPEVREVLERHLNPEYDPSLAIRAIYGQWFPWLLMLDPAWAAQKVSSIFPKDEALRDFRSVAWETYIAFCDAYDNALALLHEEYAHAIESIGTRAGSRRFLADPDQQLAAHLMSFYWRGKLKLQQPFRLLAQFYTKAPDELRGQALQAIGVGLCQMRKPPARRVLKRLRTLWEWRMSVARDGESPTSHAAELAAFGLWFASTKFDDIWSFEQLKEALAISGKIEPDHLVVERIAELAKVAPLTAVECLSLILEGDEEGWHTYGWREEVRTTLSIAMHSSNSAARQSAKELTNRLGARGFLEFRDLLGA
jgi:hypothetical protein